MKRVIQFSVILFIILHFLPVHAERERAEVWYRDIWCGVNGGEAEVILRDLTRVDCVTETHAVEFDFGDKWAEAIGQSLHYSHLTGKRAGIVLIIETEADERYWDRINADIDYWRLPIDTWSDGDGMELRFIERH